MQQDALARIEVWRRNMKMLALIEMSAPKNHELNLVEAARAQNTRVEGRERVCRGEDEDTDTILKGFNAARTLVKLLQESCYEPKMCW
jgi:hypothetical protein